MAGLELHVAAATGPVLPHGAGVHGGDDDRERGGANRRLMQGGGGRLRPKILVGQELDPVLLGEIVAIRARGEQVQLQGIEPTRRRSGATSPIGRDPLRRPQQL